MRRPKQPIFSNAAPTPIPPDTQNPDPTSAQSLNDLDHELIPLIEAIVNVGHKLKQRRP